MLVRSRAYAEIQSLRVISDFECKTGGPGGQSDSEAGAPDCMRCSTAAVRLLRKCGEQDVGKFAAGAAAQRFQDGLVLAHGFAPSARVCGRNWRNSGCDGSGRRSWRRSPAARVARGLDDLLMDQLIDAEIAVHVTVQVEAVHLVVQPLDLGNLSIADVFAGHAASQGFQPRP